MTAKEFLISKGVKSIGNQFPAGVISKWLEEYANIVLNIAAEKAELTPYQNENLIDFSRMVINKDSIINCLKD